MASTPAGISCLHCGYILGPFEVVCPRCARASVGTPGTYRCQFCHEWVPQQDKAAHEKTHNGKRPDGQLTEYMTLPPEERFQADLEGVPRVYWHLRCGAQTGMPEEIIRSYLQSPFLYNDFTYCGGCRDHVPCRELVWIETGENMQAYNNRLRAARPDLRPNLWVRFWQSAATLLSNGQL